MVLTKVVLVLAAFYEHVPAIFLTVLVIWDCTAGRQANPKEVVAWKHENNELAPWLHL